MQRPSRVLPTTVSESSNRHRAVCVTHRGAPNQNRLKRLIPSVYGSNSSYGRSAGLLDHDAPSFLISHRQYSSPLRRCVPFTFRHWSTTGPDCRTYGIVPAATVISVRKSNRVRSANRPSGRGDPGGRPPGGLSDTPQMIHPPVCGSAPDYFQSGSHLTSVNLHTQCNAKIWTWEEG
jgi:hypothetical protein